MSDYDWPPSPRLELWVLKNKLEALCRLGERKQGWIPCRLIRKAAGL